MPDTFTPEQIAQILEAFFDTVGTRQYIGARYVPIFGRKDEESIIWDNSAPYEPLTIVLYQGNSYTSRQYVPTGVEITNTQFWANTGNYNAQVEQYRQEVASFDARITANAAAIADEIENRENAISEEATARQLAITTAIDAESQARSEADTQLQEQIDTLAEQNLFVIFGDSWSEFTRGYENWVEYVNLANTLDVDVRNFAVGGAGFVREGNLIGTQITTADSDLTSDEKARTKYVILEGGVNDTSVETLGYTTWRTAIRAEIARCVTMFPNAQIIYAPNICSYAYDADRSAKCMAWFTKIKDDLQWTPTNVKTVPTLPFFWCGYQYSSVFRSDNLHLNANGARLFGKCILNSCMGTYQIGLKHYRKENNLLFTYDDCGNIDVSGTLSFTDNAVMNVMQANNELTEYMRMWANAVNPTVGTIKNLFFWNGTSGDNLWHGWMRFTGTDTIQARCDMSDVSTAALYFG